MTDAADLKLKPLFLTFRELWMVTYPLHLGEKRWVDTLFDVYKLGAPGPQSIIRDPRGYDERKAQPGNDVERLILPTKFAAWVMDVSAARGHPYSQRQAMNLLHGSADYGFDQTKP